MARKKKTVIDNIKEFIIITLSMVVGSLGWCAFLLPHKITIGGIPGISSLLYWAFGIPVQYMFFGINALLLCMALRVLGWKFCFRTIYAVIVFTIITSFFQSLFAGHPLFVDEPFLSCVLGGVLLGVGMGFALLYNASSGGSDLVAAIVHKYRDVSLGRVVLVCDLCIVTSSYLVLRNWEHVIYGYIVLFVLSYCVDYVINGRRGSVQFFIISSQWEKIGVAINNEVPRGCTVIDAKGFYTGKRVGMLFVIAHRTEARLIYQIIDEIDSSAFVSQGSVNGVYGMGFDRMKVGRRKKMAVEGFSLEGEYAANEKEKE